MFILIDEKLIMPKSLFITDIPFNLDPVIIAQIRSVFKGDHKGKNVVLKLVYKGLENVSKLLLNLYPTMLIHSGIGSEGFPQKKLIARSTHVAIPFSPFCSPFVGHF